MTRRLPQLRHGRLLPNRHSPILVFKCFGQIFWCCCCCCCVVVVVVVVVFCCCSVVFFHEHEIEHNNTEMQCLLASTPTRVALHYRKLAKSRSTSWSCGVSPSALDAPGSSNNVLANARAVVHATPAPLFAIAACTHPSLSTQERSCLGCPPATDFNFHDDKSCPGSGSDQLRVCPPFPKCCRRPPQLLVVKVCRRCEVHSQELCPLRSVIHRTVANR